MQALKISREDFAKLQDALGKLEDFFGLKRDNLLCNLVLLRATSTSNFPPILSNEELGKLFPEAAKFQDALKILAEGLNFKHTELAAELLTMQEKQLHEAQIFKTVELDTAIQIVAEFFGVKGSTLDLHLNLLQKGGRIHGGI